MIEKRSANNYTITVIVLGILCLVAAISFLPLDRLDIYFPILAILMVVVGSRITIQIPRFKTFVAVSDTFIFLTLFLYGGEYAIILSAIDAFVSSWRFCNRRITVFFNASAVAISTSAMYCALIAAGLYKPEGLHGSQSNFTNFVIALSLMAMVQFAVNTSLAAMYNSLSGDLNLWETWKSKYIWTFFSYFIGAISAGVLVPLSESAGIGIILATFPVIFFVFLSYRMYMKNIEISMQHAEQAEQYAKDIESQSEKLRESEERFRSAFDHAPIGIGLVSPAGEWLKVNLALTQILGYTEEEFLATDFQSLTLPEDLGPTLVRIHEVLGGKTANYQMEQRYLHKNGETVWASWSVSAASELKGTRPNLIFQIQDVTDRKSAENKLQHEATHDVLTGLPNRSLFMSRLADALVKVHDSRSHKVSILFIDLDRFKYVNDSLGHLVGDELLKSIAETLRDCMRPSDMVARLGGDEFTILVEGKYDVSEVTRIAERIQEKFSRPFDLLGHEVYSSASIGILHASDQHKTPEDMMRDADTAMYQAKRAGKARHEVFDEEMHRAAKETLQLETDLRRAVERGEIGVVYQPILNLESHSIEGVEVLARWSHGTLGSIPPGKFVPLAEEIGLIDRLCEQVLRKACVDVGSIRYGTGGDPIAMSINLSCKQFAQSTLVQSICGILDETAFSPERLRLEITESVFVEHPEQAVGMLNKLRGIGVDINIDDFGTGYSNLSYLMKLPISTLKVDRSFVAMIDGESSNNEIVKTIVNLARNLGLKLVAEGIETAEQLDTLKRLGCESGQGYYFAAPMNFAELCDWLDERDVIVPCENKVGDVSTISTLQ